MKQNKDLILFDWDRTISDVEGPTNLIIEEVFRSFENIQGYPSFIEKFRSPLNQGRKVYDRMQDILGLKIGRDYYEKFLQIKNHTPIKPEIFTGLVEQIERIKSESSRVLGIVTNKSSKDVLDENFKEVSSYFHFLIGGDNVLPNQLKPSGYLLDRALLQLNEAPRRLIMVGDTSHDINALGNSNFTGIKNGILSFWGIKEDERILQKNAIDETKLDVLKELNHVSMLSNTVDEMLV